MQHVHKINSKPVAGVYVRGIWAKRFPNNNSDATKSGTGHLFFVFEVTAGGEAMGGLPRGARAHSRAHYEDRREREKLPLRSVIKR